MNWWFLCSYLIVGLSLCAVPRLVRRQIDFASGLVLLCVPLAFFAPSLLKGKVPVPADHVARFAPWNSPGSPSPANPTFSDVITQFVPWAGAVRSAWLDGLLPFRNRWNGCGSPLGFNPTSGAFFPINLVLLTLPTVEAVAVLAALRLLVALLGTFLWLSETGLSTAAARFGALSFGLSWALTPWLFNPATMSIAMWPWVFFGIEMMADRSFRLDAFLLLLAVLTFWPLAGHPETVALGALFGALWFLLRALVGDLKAAPQVLARASLAALLAIALAAFALIPQLETIRASNRLRLALRADRFDYVPWVPYHPIWLGAVLTTAFPTALGDLIESPMLRGAAGSIVEMGFGHFGMVGLAIATCALLVRRRNRRSLILAALAVLGLCGAAGFPIARQAIDCIPGLGLSPPLRLLILVSAAGAALAAMGIDLLREDRPRSWYVASSILVASAVGAAVCYLALRSQYLGDGSAAVHRRAAITIGGVLLLSAAICLLAGRRKISSHVAVTTLTLIATAELLGEGARLYSSYDSRSLFPETSLLSFLHSRPQPFRVAGVQSALCPNTNIAARLESVEIQDPVERADYVDVLNRTAGYPPFDYFRSLRDLDSSILDFLNVKYLVGPPGWTCASEKWKMVYDGVDGRIFENHRAMPRFYAPVLVGSVKSAANPTVDSVRAFGEPLEAFLRVGKFENALVLAPLGTGTPESPSVNNRADIGIVTENANRIEIAIGPRGKGPDAIVVASIVNDGGWSAVDDQGKVVPTGFANGPFLAMRVSGSSRRVVLTYRPPGFIPGAVVTAATLLLVVAIVITSRSRRKRSTPPNTPPAVQA